jgi:hypothetical protein
MNTRLTRRLGRVSVEALVVIDAANLRLLNVLYSQLYQIIYDCPQHFRVKGWCCSDICISIDTSPAYL